MWTTKGARRMECRSCLSDPTALIVADTSVVINLNATECSKTILGALPNRVVVTNEVRLELELDQRNHHGDACALAALVQSRHVDVVRLGSKGLGHFANLVMGPAAQTLDDGEAATIAYALEHGGTVLIDERKANRICGSRFPSLPKGCTVDMLAQDNVRAALGGRGLGDAVFNALFNARMRVLPHHLSWVVQLIGAERAALCVSLPGSVRESCESVDGQASVTD